MPVIVFANSKGGSGKSTTALILAGELADRGAEVVLIDADPRRPAVGWSKLPGKPPTLEVISSGGERTILDEIEEAARRVPFVIVDLEGTASRLTSYAIGQADLVLVPAQEEHQDSEAALATLKEVERDAKAVRRPIPAAVVMTCTSAIKSKTARHVVGQFKAQSVPMLATEVARRGAYSSLWSVGGTVRNIDPKEAGNLPAAIANADRLVAEVLALLQPARSQAPKKSHTKKPQKAKV